MSSDFISILISIFSLFFAFITWIKTESYKRRLRIGLNCISDNSHSFLKEMMESKSTKLLKDRYSSFNHTIVMHLISIDKKLARDWIVTNKPKKQWSVWENKLDVKIKKQ